ncbi:MAG: hypothetical protein ABIR96_06050 [Bdellovibrionota bacterium]
MKTSMSFCRHVSDGLQVLCAVATLAAVSSVAKAANSFDSYFPRDQYPALSDVQPVDMTDANSRAGFVGEMKTLSSEISKSVKEVAQKRNLTCFGNPCLMQVFPLMYSKPDSGFFGGFRARLTDITTQNPYLYALNAQIIRSDTAQWITALDLDVPRVPLLLFEPRVKLRGSYARSTEFRYTGEGRESQVLSERPDADQRYSTNVTALGSTILLPLFVRGERKFGLYGSYDNSITRNDPFESPQDSILFSEKPEAFRGGTFRAAGAGFFFDTRPTEIFTREGGMIEFGVTVGLLKIKPNAEVFEENLNRLSYRITLVDRRYQTRGRWTLAHRLTMDALLGDPPFWEQAAIGGTDPIADVAGSGLMKGYTGGRFHENYKFIESLEFRHHQNDFHAVGLRGDLALMPLAIDAGFMSDLFAWSLATGLDVVWNKSFLTRFYVAFTPKDWAMRLKFSQEF